MNYIVFQDLEKLSDHLNKRDYHLFIGSSSIRRWNTIEEDMYPYEVLKRGYGGAHYYDLIHFIDRLISEKNEAKAVVIFVANDITGKSPSDKLDSDLTPKEVVRLFRLITKKIIRKFGETFPIYVIETTPTPSRWSVWDQISKANDLIKSYTDRKSNLNFISTRDFFLNEKKYPIGEYFVEDSLHLSQKGYDLWQRIIKMNLN